MPVAVQIQPCSDSNDRSSTAEDVIAQFGNILANQNLLCFIDNQDCSDIQQRFGGANRGGFIAVGHITCPPFLRYVWDSIFVEELPSGIRKPKYSELIYVHNSTCSSQIGLAMTLSHELQHSLQYVTQPQLMRLNNAVRHFEPMVLEWAQMKTLFFADRG